MAAGMKEVATLAGVAVGTVSNVLNHPDLVRPRTRARVEAAMEQLGFIPNGSARQLRAGRSRCLGLVVLDVTNPFFTEVARGVEDYAQAAGYAVILCNSDEAHDKERRYLRVLEEQRVRGILITPVHGRSPELRRIRDRGTPVVLLDRPGSPAQCSVAVDDRRGGEIAVSYLLGLGHRSIALVNGPTAIRQCADRRWGAYRAVEQAGLHPGQVLAEVTVPAMNPRGGAAGHRGHQRVVDAQDGDTVGRQRLDQFPLRLRDGLARGQVTPRNAPRTLIAEVALEQFLAHPLEHSDGGLGGDGLHELQATACIFSTSSNKPSNRAPDR